MKKDLPVPTNKMGVVRTQGVQFVDQKTARL